MVVSFSNTCIFLSCGSKIADAAEKIHSVLEHFIYVVCFMTLHSYDKIIGGEYNR